VCWEIFTLQILICLKIGVGGPGQTSAARENFSPNKMQQVLGYVRPGYLSHIIFMIALLAGIRVINISILPLKGLSREIESGYKSCCWIDLS
jgi:hypothetical protein